LDASRVFLADGSQGPVVFEGR